MYLAADGVPLTQRKVAEFAGLAELVLVAGRYEGVDERFVERASTNRSSVGDVVLSGGELPALTVVDAVARLLPGTLGDAESAVQESFADGLLDWPHYTRPEVWAGGGADGADRAATTRRSRAGGSSRRWGARGSGDPDLLRGEGFEQRRSAGSSTNTRRSKDATRREQGRSHCEKVKNDEHHQGARKPSV